jgi:hypothetical protein
MPKFSLHTAKSSNTSAHPRLCHLKLVALHAANIALKGRKSTLINVKHTSNALRNYNDAAAHDETNENCQFYHHHSLAALSNVN